MGGVVGTSYIYSGHNDAIPANSLPADINDDNGYSGTGNSTPSNQKRTLTLTNGEVIWDFAGNVYEWTSGQVSTGKPGIVGAGGGWRQWPNITQHGTLSPDPFPATTGLSGASTWNYQKGIGSIWSNADDGTLYGMIRSGYWADTSNVGVLTLAICDLPSGTRTTLGFRVTH